MSRIDKLVAGVTIGACAVGATVALHTTGSHSPPTTTSRPAAAATGDAQVQHATRSLYRSATRLTEEVRRARKETTTVLASSYAKLATEQAGLAAERAQLAGEQQQINAEVLAINARAAQLSQESAQLQREAATLAGAARGATPPTTPGGNRHDD